MYDKIKIYDKLPYWMQHLALNAYSLHIHHQRYGSSFKKAFDNLQKTQWFSPEKIEEYQLQLMRPLVKHAYDTVPFYRRLYDKHGVQPSDIKDFRDILRLPIITRDDVRNAGHEMVSSLFPKSKLIHGHTSGTTGSPLSFYWDRHTCIYTNAVDWRQKLWGGVHYGDRIALLLGRTIVPTTKTTPPLWQQDRIHNVLWMSSFHLSETYLPFYFEKLHKFRPVAIEGYPSTIYILARYLQATGQTFPLKAVFTSSETLLPIQRTLIEERFETKVFDFFGMAERVAFATQCAEAHEYHLNFEYAFNEIVDSSGTQVESGKDGYLVGTSLLNYAMPFIRYRTSDITSIKSGQCACGRHMPRFMGVTTKDEDIVVTPEGKLVSSSVLTHPFKPLDTIAESQIIQEEIDLLRVRVVPREDYHGDESAHLIAALRERVGPTMQIKIELVKSIPRTKAGKLRWVISKVPLPL